MGGWAAGGAPSWLGVRSAQRGSAGASAPAWLTPPACLPTPTTQQGKDKEGGGGSGELFEGDGLPSKPASGGKSKVYAGGARSQAVKVGGQGRGRRCCVAAEQGAGRHWGKLRVW